MVPNFQATCILANSKFHSLKQQAHAFQQFVQYFSQLMILMLQEQSLIVLSKWNHIYGQETQFFYFILQQIISKFNYMKTLFISLFFLILIASVQSQCCLRFDGKKCAECPSGTHLYKGNCIFDIKNCATYKDGFDCANCITGYNLNLSGDCQKIVIIGPLNPTIPIVTPQPSFTETTIQFSQMDAPYVEYFMLCEDLLRSTKPEIEGSKTISAKLRKYENGTTTMLIQYESQNNVNYLAVLDVNTQSFTLRQVSFTKIATPSPSKAVLLIKTQVLNLSNLIHKQTYSLIQIALSSTPSTAIANIKSGTIGSFSDGSFNMALQYVSKIGSEVEITATISSDKVVKITDTKVTKQPISSSSSTGTNPTIDNLNLYVVFNPLNPIQQNFLICKDFLWGQIPDFKGVQPSLTKKYSSGGIIYYLLRMAKADGSIWDIALRIDTNTYVMKVEKTVQVSFSTKPTINSFVRVDNIQIYKDFTFILVLQYINKQSNNKYLDAIIKSVDRMQNSGVITYKIAYVVNGVWEVTANINAISFVASNFSEIQTQPAIINNSSKTPKSNLTNSSTSINSIIGLTSPNTSNSTINLTLNFIPSNNSKPIVEGEKILTLIPTTPASVIPSQSFDKGSSNIKEETKIEAQPKGNAASEDKEKKNLQSEVRQQLKSFNSQQMFEMAAGLTSLQKSDLSGSQFKDVDSIIRASNSVELKSALVVGAFVKNVSFSNKTFQVFYLQPSNMEIYVALVSRDVIKKRNFIISFNKMGR